MLPWEPKGSTWRSRPTIVKDSILERPWRAGDAEATIIREYQPSMMPTIRQAQIVLGQAALAMKVPWFIFDESRHLFTCRVPMD
ncbi:MAG: hypothetical protein ACRDTA_20275 [Pseudonocardiaceae bacterium]